MQNNFPFQINWVYGQLTRYNRQGLFRCCDRTLFFLTKTIGKSETTAITMSDTFQVFSLNAAQQATTSSISRLSEIHFARYQKYTLQEIRNTLGKISEMHKRMHIAHFQDICKCTGSLNEFSISGGSKWQMSALPKFELNLQICERSTHPHQFEMAWLYLIKYGPAGSSSKLLLPFKMHSWGNFALGSNQFNLLIAFHPQNLCSQNGENAFLIPINVVRHL